MGSRYVGVSAILSIGAVAGVWALFTSTTRTATPSSPPPHESCASAPATEPCGHKKYEHDRSRISAASIETAERELVGDSAVALPKVEIANRVGYELYTSRLSNAGRRRDARVLFDDPVMSALINPNGIVLSDADEARIFAMYADHLERLAALSDEMLATRAVVINRMFASGCAEGLAPATTPPIGLSPEQAASVAKSVVLPPHTLDEEVYGRTVDGEMKAVRIRRGHVPEYDSVKTMLCAAAEDVLTEIRGAVLAHQSDTTAK